MSEDRARLSAISVLGGPLHGKTYRFPKKGAEVLIGSGPGCDFRLEAPGVAARHLRIVAGNDEPR